MLKQKQKSLNNPAEFRLVLLDFIDDIITWIANLNTSQLPILQFKINGNQYSIGALIAKIKPIIDHLIPKVTKIKGIKESGQVYKLSNIKLIDLISFNKTDQLDYKLGFNLLLSLLKNLMYLSTSIYIQLLKDVILENRTELKKYLLL